MKRVSGQDNSNWLIIYRYVNFKIRNVEYQIRNSVGICIFMHVLYISVFIVFVKGIETEPYYWLLTFVYMSGKKAPNWKTDLVMPENNDA